MVKERREKEIGAFPNLEMRLFKTVPGNTANYLTVKTADLKSHRLRQLAILFFIGFVGHFQNGLQAVFVSIFGVHQEVGAFAVDGKFQVFEKVHFLTAHH